MSMREIKDNFYIKWLESVSDNYVYSAVMTRELSLMKDGTYLGIFNIEQNDLLINHQCTT